MFHQVFICNPDDEEEAHTEQDFKAHTEQDFKEEDDVGAEPAELEVKQETQELKLETSDLKVETKPWVDSVYSDLVQVMKREPVCSDLVQEMKLEPKPEPGLEEPYEILPDIEPEEDKEGLRRKLTDKKRAENIGIKAIDVIKVLKNENSNEAINDKKYKHVLQFGNIAKHNLQNDEKPPELGSNDGLAQNKNCYTPNENCTGQNLRPAVSNSSDNEENEDILEALLSSQRKDASSCVEYDNEVSKSSDKKHAEADSGSDWEQDYLRSTGKFPNSKKEKKGKPCKQNSSKKQKLCLDTANVKEKTNSLNQNSVNTEIVNKLVSKKLAQEEPPNITTFFSTSFSNAGKEVNAVFKVIGCPDISVINGSTLVCKVKKKVLENDHQQKIQINRLPYNKNKNKPKTPSVDEIFDKQIFICTVCKKLFKTNRQYVKHTQNSLCFGFRKKRNHQCDICGKAFPGADKLENHRNSHTNARPHKCTECDKCFNSTAARINHFNKEHKKILKLLYLCSFCGITSKSISHMLAHEETHRLPEESEVPKPFNCHHCGKGFISRFKLICHQNTHQKHKCSKCTVEFDTRTSLRKHKEVVHGIVKIFTCKTCSKTFETSLNLKNHQFSHSNVLSFFCDICDKGFKLKTHLKQHMITHSDERPISCPECDETFKRPTHLKQHLASAHGKRNKPRKSRTKT